MAKIEEKLKELGLSDEQVGDFLSDVEIRNRQIEENNMVRREDEVQEKVVTEEVEEVEREVSEEAVVDKDVVAEETVVRQEASEVTEEIVEEQMKEAVAEQDLEIVIDEESINAIFELMSERINNLVISALDVYKETVARQREEYNEVIERLNDRIAMLERDDSVKVREAVDDLPESRRQKKIVYRPSQQVARDIETGDAVDITSQMQKMLELRASKKAKQI